MSVRIFISFVNNDEVRAAGKESSTVQGVTPGLTVAERGGIISGIIVLFLVSVVGPLSAKSSSWHRVG